MAQGRELDRGRNPSRSAVNIGIGTPNTKSRSSIAKGLAMTGTPTRTCGLMKVQSLLSGIGGRSGTSAGKKMEQFTELSREMITPEMAAFVVKEYLLPMFESDGKKLLSRKHAPKLTNDEPEELSNEDVLKKDYQSILKQSTTVFSELKLSGTLLGDIG